MWWLRVDKWPSFPLYRKLRLIKQTSFLPVQYIKAATNRHTSGEKRTSSVSPKAHSRRDATRSPTRLIRPWPQGFNAVVNRKGGRFDLRFHGINLAHKRAMYKKTAFLTILIILIPLAFPLKSLKSQDPHVEDSFTPLAPTDSPEESEGVTRQSAENSGSTSAIEVQLSNLPPAVLPSQHKSMVKFCGGEPISQCENVEFTHCDLALLLLDILALGERQTCEDAFEVLESRTVSPAIGWAKDNPQKRMTPREMEEVRCSISLAYEKGLIEEHASIVTVALNTYCVELEVSLKALKDSGVLKNRSYHEAETGYQGGGNGVLSPSL